MNCSVCLRACLGVAVWLRGEKNLGVKGAWLGRGFTGPPPLGLRDVLDDDRDTLPGAAAGLAESLCDLLDGLRLCGIVSPCPPLNLHYRHDYTAVYCPVMVKRFPLKGSQQ